MAVINGTNDNDVLNGATENSMQRVSTTALDGQADGDSFNAPGNFEAFSPDGTKIAFFSSADDLVPDDTNGAADVFVKDLTTGAVTRVSTDSSGIQGDGNSFAPTFSPDGTKIAFENEGGNLVPDDTNNAKDVFIKDLATGAVTRVSTDSAGIQGDHISFAPAFSPDGTKVTFTSFAGNLVPGDTQFPCDVFVKDLITGAVTLVSADSAEVQGNANSYRSSFSPDGTKIAFFSEASNLVPDDTNGAIDLFIKDLITGAVTCASTDSAGAFGNGAVDTTPTPAFSPDGTKIVFASSAGNLAPNDANGARDVFVKDLVTGAVTLVSTDSAGNQGNNYSDLPDFSPDGAKIVFASGADNLVQDDTNGADDIFIKDLATGATTRVSGGGAGIQGNTGSFFPVFSRDGSQVLFHSSASTLVPNDTNSRQDLFLATLSDVEDDTISGNRGDDTIHGLGGSDTLDGNSGNDALFGDGGGDIMHGGTGDDVMDGGAGDDAVTGNSGNDLVRGGAGDDFLNGSNGNDMVFGDDGDDLLGGGDGADVLYGGGGDDRIFGSSAQDAVYGGAGADAMDGGSGTDSLHYDGDSAGVTINLGNHAASGGEAEGDTFTSFENLYGGAGKDRLTGSSGKNVISGNDGNDKINGGAGSDTLSGGAGADTFVLDARAFTGIDTVTDFSIAQGDRINLRSILIGYAPLTSAITDFVNIVNSGGDSNIFIDANGAVDGQSFTQVAQITGVTGLTDESLLLASHVLEVT